jgi:hypothetical protein
VRPEGLRARWPTIGSRHRYTSRNEIGREFPKPTVLAFRPAEFQRHVVPILITALSKTLANCGHLLDSLGGPCIEKTDYRQRALLRARRERPGSRAA